MKACQHRDDGRGRCIDCGAFIDPPAPRVKQPGCEHQHASEPNCAPAVLNSYHCDDCDVSWTDEHSCGCDDECPECGTALTPVSSEEIAPCSCEYL